MAAQVGVQRSCSRSRKNLSDGVPSVLTQPLRELHLELHDQVSSAIGSLGVGQPLPAHPSLHPRLYDVRGRNGHRPAVQSGRLDRAATQGLMEQEEQRTVSDVIHHNTV